jgi:ABC-type uncharacterized transport system permease subunit
MQVIGVVIRFEPDPEDVSPLIYFSPLIGTGLFAINYWIWTPAVNSYTGTGS